MTAWRSRVLTGTVSHRRHRDSDNAFRYRIWHLLVDVDEFDAHAAEVVGLRPGHRWPVGLRTQDHIGPEDLPLREKVRRWLAGRGTRLPDGRLLLVADPRVAGHVFNPVSWWFAFDEDGGLRLVVAEVRNTFGDWHAYLLDDLEVTGNTVTATTDKAFHVSPFLPVGGLTYRFTIRPPVATPDPAAPAEQVAVHMAVSDRDGLLLEAAQSATAAPLTTAGLWHAVLRHPLVTLRTIALIHWQALRLWRDRVGFHRRPTPPDSGLDAVTDALTNPEVSA